MTKQTALAELEAKMDSTYVAREKALAELIVAVDVYKAFQTLEPAGLVHEECGDRLDDAVCDAAVDLLNADAAYSNALEEHCKAQTKSKASNEDAGTLESVKAAVLAAQKRGVRTAVVQRVVIEHGGRKGDIPSLRALPRENAAKCVAAIEALPSR